MVLRDQDTVWLKAGYEAYKLCTCNELIVIYIMLSNVFVQNSEIKQVSEPKCFFHLSPS